MKTVDGVNGHSSKNPDQGKDMVESIRKIVSFRDMVIDAHEFFGPADDVPSIDEDDVSDDESDDSDENDLECPTIKVSNEEKRRLRSRWKSTLSIKLIDHSVGYMYLTRRVKALWKINSHIEIIDVGFGSYVVSLRVWKKGSVLCIGVLGL